MLWFKVNTYTHIYTHTCTNTHMQTHIITIMYKYSITNVHCEIAHMTKYPKFARRKLRNYKLFGLAPIQTRVGLSCMGNLKSCQSEHLTPQMFKFWDKKNACNFLAWSVYFWAGARRSKSLGFEKFCGFQFISQKLLDLGTTNDSWTPIIFQLALVIQSHEVLKNFAVFSS